MTQQEERVDSGIPDDLNVEDFRYHRVGYIDLGRRSDHLLTFFLGLIPGDGKLPLHWKYISNEYFQKKYGQVGPLLWAAANNSHMLMVNGFHAIRIWHDTAASCYVDLADNIAGQLSPKMPAVEDIPLANAKKSKPFTKRVKLTQQWQMKELANLVKRTYGLDNTRFSLFKP